jgi:hypothetical protein
MTVAGVRKEIPWLLTSLSEMLKRNDDDFLPPNIITPNGDRLNDYFAMVKKDETTGELVSILPKDNCTGHFEVSRSTTVGENKCSKARIVISDGMRMMMLRESIIIS